MDKIIRFSVSLPEKLLEELDKKVIAQGYASRSEFTRDLIREKIVKDDWQDDGSDVIGVLTMIYTHHQNELVQKILEIQHDAHLKIMCNTHVHVNHENCLETIMIQGKVSKIKDFAQKIGGLKGVKFSKLVEASIPAS
ncbi:MAG: nickel-responsive transcriptional regulator NikR [Sulfurospirillaceae bacterium]|jgi:CopG family nickel-responsive transcriptional regulator|nr:nickel-responsive transcriptional regulator NikR [Sulfurospirillaceae bacterium]MDD2826267.1 nickel-responsive transcriptional regulator NikR [Sulfurospirillaceae bacterium]